MEKIKTDAESSISQISSEGEYYKGAVLWLYRGFRSVGLILTTSDSGRHQHSLRRQAALV